jgi:hypothetical protein
MLFLCIGQACVSEKESVGISPLKWAGDERAILYVNLSSLGTVMWVRLLLDLLIQDSLHRQGNGGRDALLRVLADRQVSPYLCQRPFLPCDEISSCFVN